MEFTIWGHPNTLSINRNTLEFTKEDFLTKRGDCILGIKADFRLGEIKKLLKHDHLVIEITCDGMIERIEGITNKDFNSDHEIVLRRSEYPSERTLMFRADRVASDINKNMISYLKESDNFAKVRITGR